MSEDSVGITAFTNEHPGISGCIFKQRFSGVVIRLYEESNNCDNVSKSSEDFIVREIGLDGEVAILTDIVCSG